MRVNYDGIKVEGWLKEGRFYARCVSAEPTTGQYGDEGIELTWVALYPQEAAGLRTRDRLWGSGNAAPRLKIAARVLGLRDHGSEVEVMPEHFVGKECWIEVQKGKPFTGRDGTEKQGYQVAWDGYKASGPPAKVYETPEAKPEPAGPRAQRGPAQPDDDGSVPF